MASPMINGPWQPSNTTTPGYVEGEVSWGPEPPSWRSISNSVIGIAAVIFLANVLVSGKNSLLLKPIQRRIKAWSYLLDGPAMIHDGYKKANGKTFDVITPGERIVFVSGHKAVKELESQPETALSLYAASRKILMPKYTMHGLHIQDSRGAAGAGFSRAVRVLLTNNLPRVLPYLGDAIRARIAEIRAEGHVVDGVKQTDLYPMFLQLTSLSTGTSIFGKELASNAAFMKDAFNYIESVVMGAEMVRLSPKWLEPIMGRFVTHKIKTPEILFNLLYPIAEERLRERERASLGEEVPKHTDMISWILETAPADVEWTSQRIVQEVMAVWFGSIHSTAFIATTAIYDLCLHPEYLAPLRAEIARGGYAEFERNPTQGLPLMDSFLKESARVTPVDYLSTRREVIAPFALADGTRLHKGDWLCTPAASIGLDAAYFPEPTKFDGFRFAPRELVASLAADGSVSEGTRMPKASKIVDVDPSWLLFGTGKLSCPGRFLATATIKSIVANVIANYDMELVDAAAPRQWSWRSTAVCREDVKVVLTPRAN
ncbi:cytochrome P450 [Lasiosphaeria ovina]|uniref:Cytochrome P450 n=1 Tax=Lasiosphaeria ovina TaxID=92902 RepID=A0AAE0JXT0_9PEZI|nr:cytochrome P450 [Lasiosphaeria ovina]